MKATQDEMKLHILTVQEQVNNRMGKMDQRTRHQVHIYSVPANRSWLQITFTPSVSETNGSVHLRFQSLIPLSDMSNLTVLRFFVRKCKL